MDDLVLQVRKVREEYAKQFGYDLQAIHRDLKEQEQASGRRVVSLPPRRPRMVLPNPKNRRTNAVVDRQAE
jgi:hypothetical protein